MMKLNITDWQLAVCKLQGNDIPEWACSSTFLNFSITPTEISLVCEESLVPVDVDAERGWKCLVVDGILDFSLVGIIARVTSVLAEQKISVFVLSTYDTDYILIKNEQFNNAINTLEQAGYQL